MKIFLLSIFLLNPIYLNSQTILADLTCEGKFSCYNCDPVVRDAPFKGSFTLGNDPSIGEKNYIFVHDIPNFNVFWENDDTSTYNVLEFGTLESNSNYGQINRTTGEILLVNIKTINNDGGWTSNSLYIGNCKKTEKLF
tara:strand:+ start:595 stop:1011 length:417 start_codon:yes stop_codon:yes gene_type:complete